ncbi:MAG: DUF2784 domain-containing protein [Chlorobi bacterium]|nr:DUF2784 domain-containing protein [Chlorobiota bacterium]
MVWLWKTLDIILEVVHIVVVVFNLIGWIFPTTRFLHWISVNITAFSWLIMGFFYGFGYCFLTDWHWKVKAQLGRMPSENSFITYFLHKLGVIIDGSTVDLITAIAFASVFILSWILNFGKVKRIVKKK